MRYKRALALLLTTAALVLSGCAAENDSGSAGTPTFNQADVQFVRGMIPHHRQAIQMTKLAEGRAADPEVEQLAQRIEDAQEPEIETMRGWLRNWNRPLHTMDMGDSGSMDHGGSSDSMSAMIGAGDMQALREAKGPAFDEAFLTMMIEHHKGAVDMAATQERKGKDPEAIGLARKIQRDQAAEIETMTRLLGG